jgi:hypothetical protein
MPDITMCSGEGCAIAEFCFRHTAAPHERQLWFTSPPYDREFGGCDYYLVNGKVAENLEAPR